MEKKKSILKPLIFVIIGIALLVLLYLPMDIGPLGNAVEKMGNGVSMLQKESVSDEMAATNDQSSNLTDGLQLIGLYGGASVLGLASAIGGGAVAGKNAKKNKASK